MVELPVGDEALDYESYINDFVLENVPTCSLEALEEILSNAEKVQGAGEGTDNKQFASMLADTFEYNDIDDCILEHMIDVVCDVLTRVEEYINETLNFIANP